MKSTIQAFYGADNGVSDLHIEIGTNVTLWQSCEEDGIVMDRIAFRTLCEAGLRELDKQS